MTDPAKHEIYAFEGFRLDLNRRLLLAADGAPVPIKPKVFDTLACLVERSGEVLDKGTLMQAVWGDVVVEENSLNQHISTLRHIFGETPGENRFIVTVPGRGYCFVAPVKATSPPSGRPAVSIWRPRQVAGWAIALLTVGAVIGFFVVGPADRPTIAVLPFEDLSENGDQEYFSDGITEELLNLLSRIEELKVTARTSAFSFKGTSATIREIAERLDVAFLVEGSVRHSGEKLRVTAKLIDATTEKQIWAETYERTAGDDLLIQDEIAREIVDRLEIDLVSTPTTADVPRNQEVLDRYLRVKSVLASSDRSVDSLLQALEWIQAVIEQDPEYFPARLALADVYLALQNTPEFNTGENYRRFRDALEYNARVRPDRFESHAWLGWSSMEQQGDVLTAAEHYKRALEIEPYNLLLLPYIAQLALDLNRPELSVEINEYVIERNQLCARCYVTLASAYTGASRYDDAVDALERAQSLDPGTYYGLYPLALILRGDPEAALAYIGSQTDAPRFDIDRWDRLATSAVALHALGREDEFERVVEQLRDASAPPMTFAQIYSQTGDLEAAFDIAIEMQPDEFRIPQFDRGLRRLREHENWPDLARKVGLWPDDPRDDVVLDVDLPD